MARALERGIGSVSVISRYFMMQIDFLNMYFNMGTAGRNLLEQDHSLPLLASTHA